MLKQLEYLFKLARERKIRPKDKSYTNQLLKDKILSKEKVSYVIIGRREGIFINS